MNLYIPISRSEGLYKEKGSKFIAYLFPVNSEEDVKTCLNEVKTEHPKARHHCYAFRFGQEGLEERANDDGEPSGSAGLPILNQIRSEELTNVLVVVVRYFGGTKLGVSGLIRAYKEATKSAAQMTKKELYVERENIEFSFPIQILGEVERILARKHLEPSNATYDATCRFQIRIESESREDILSELTSLKDLILKI